MRTSETRGLSGMTDKLKKQNEWDAEHTTQIKLKLNNSTDADIIKWLNEQSSKQGSIKALIRAEITK